MNNNSLSEWTENSRRYARQLSKLLFTDINARCRYLFEQDFHPLLIPDSFVYRETPSARYVHKAYDSFSSILILYRANGEELTLEKSHTFACIHDLPCQGAVHTHDYIELFYVVTGSFSQILLGETYTFHAGDVVITDKNCEHADLLDGTDSAILFFKLDSAYVEHILRHNNTQSELERFLFHAISQKKREQSFLIFTKDPSETENDLNLPVLFEQLIQEEYHDYPGKEQMIEGLLLRLFFALGNTYSMVRHTDERVSREKLILFEIEKYIRKNPADVDAASLEQIFHYHRNYYNRLLQKYRGESLKSYIQKIRMKKACELLKSTDLPIREIARLCGYENTNFFYSLFTRRTGMKPADYRKSSTS